MLKLLANEGRLLVLCHLVERPEIGAGELARRVGLSPSALSQHLARLREHGLVASRRDAQSIYYRIGDDRVRRLIALLHDLYCPHGAEEIAS